MMPDLRVSGLHVWVCEVCECRPVMCRRWDQVGEGSADAGLAHLGHWMWRAEVFGLGYRLPWLL